MTKDDEDPTPDLRYTTHDDGHVRIERSLDGSGSLVRGSSTHSHSIRFSARAVPRDREKLAPVDSAPKPVSSPIVAEPEPVVPPPDPLSTTKTARFLGRVHGWWNRGSR